MSDAEENDRVLSNAKNFIRSNHMITENKIYISKSIKHPTVVVRVVVVGINQEGNHFVRFVNAVRAKVPAEYAVKFVVMFSL